MEEESRLLLHIYPPVKMAEDAGEERQEEQRKLREKSQSLIQNPKSKIQNSYTLYSDAGDGYGAWRLDRFGMVRDEKSLTLTWEAQGEYAFPYQSIQLHLHGFQPYQVWVDGKEVAIQGKIVSLDRFQQVRF